MKRITDEPHYNMTETMEQIVHVLVLMACIGAVMFTGLILGG